jgi:hypothetical protein
VVRRTSSPSDPHRAVATVVLGKRPVAVENHLIVLLPKNKTLRACRQAMRLLRDDSTDKRLDRTMRCRHLTVEAVASLPIVTRGLRRPTGR